MSKTKYPAIELPSDDYISTQRLDIYDAIPFWQSSALSWRLIYYGRDIFLEDITNGSLLFPADLELDYPNLTIDLDGKKVQIYQNGSEHELAKDIFRILKNGHSLSMQECRHLAEEKLGVKIFKGTIEDKALQEIIDAVVVRVARLLRYEYLGLEFFDKLVDLYENQPILSTRSSSSIELQAYSTPIPLAYLASYLAQVDGNSNKTIYEPTAGHGALLLEANPIHCHANELDPNRAEELIHQGYSEVTSFNAAEYIPNQKFDIVLANPPFGRVLGNKGHRTYYCGQFNTKQIDHAIIMRSLLTMKPNGRAVFILAGQMGNATRRSQGYNSMSNRAFWKYLYENYNVVQHVSIAGKVYARQGARFPIDLVVIAGVGESKLPLPAVEVPKFLILVGSYELYSIPKILFFVSSLRFNLIEIV